MLEAVPQGPDEFPFENRESFLVIALEIPVFLSSLLQIPLMTLILNPHKKIGVITANASSLTPDILEKVGITAKMPLIIRGLEKYPEAHSFLVEEKGSFD